MWVRRGLYRALWVGAIVLPAWVLLARAFFGAPLGYQFVAQIVLVPILFAVQAVAIALVFLRRDNRTRRAVSWIDAGLLTLTWLGQLGIGFFLVDSTSSRSAGSAFSALVGNDAVALSTALSAASIVVTIAAGAALLVASIWQSIRAAREGFRSTLAEMERVVQGGTPGSSPTSPGSFAADPEHTIRITPRA
ncbi:MULTISPECIES: hypothetical protein [unclassified Frondihabitans]|uniref:hypothetical protein n=1 Tax=unclassified Frondihabitans TaxID=2626248 RepID=UPI000F516340|nr:MULTISPECIES: hypothetical protein [unclassified Frondihabitans]RPE74431.1 hypothetical protein EDF37_3173 [Frondihabitans sp. PhB153]RPF02860.1 hypothetical protein EDF39_3241 [Frondihabitans sp. PhB161]